MILDTIVTESRSHFRSGSSGLPMNSRSGRSVMLNPISSGNSL